MRKYEYKVIENGFMYTNSEIEAENKLNQLGSEGWKIVKSIGEGRSVFIRELENRLLGRDLETGEYVDSLPKSKVKSKVK